MTNSYLLESIARPAVAAGRVFTGGRAGFAAALVVVLALATALLPGAGTAYAEESAPVPKVTSVNINTADAETLTAALKGVGNARAVEIVRYREAYGPFTSVDELAEVKGIGKSTLDNNRAVIKLE